MNKYNIYMRTTMSDTHNLYSYENIGCFATDLTEDEVNDILLKFDKDSCRSVQYFATKDEVLCGVHYV